MTELDEEIWMDLEDEDEAWLDLGDQFDEPLAGEPTCLSRNCRPYTWLDAPSG